VSPDSAAAREAQRIRDVYARRASSGRERRYSLFLPAHLFHAQALERALTRALRREQITTLAGQWILDIGCGGGSWLTGLTRFGALADCLYGVDLREEALPTKGDANYAAASGGDLPFQSGSFDLVCQLTMMSSVLDISMRRRIAGEMLRVLRPGGRLLWYDFTVNPFNRDVTGIRLSQLRDLFPGATLHVERVTLAPPLTRLLAPRLWLACEAMEQIPWLRTHLLATIRAA
jgi:SAM-dependent methyltransferase